MTTDLDAASQHAAPATPAVVAAEPTPLRRAAPWIAGFAALAFVGAGVSAIALGGMKEQSEGAVSTAAGESVQIALNPDQPPPVIPASTGKLEVLPAYMAASAPTPPEPTPRLAAQPEAQDAWTPMPAQPVSNPVAERCAAARSLAEDMVCGDAELAADDRRLNRVYRAALAAGIIPAEELRADQRDWLDIREQAARRGVRAVEEVYRQRIAELEEVSG